MHTNGSSVAPCFHTNTSRCPCTPAAPWHGFSRRGERRPSPGASAGHPPWWAYAWKWASSTCWPAPISHILYVTLLSRKQPPPNPGEQVWCINVPAPWNLYVQRFWIFENLLLCKCECLLNIKVLTEKWISKSWGFFFLNKNNLLHLGNTNLECINNSCRGTVAFPRN